MGQGQSASGIGRLWRRVRMNPTLDWGCEISPSGVTLARWDGGSTGAGSLAWRPLSAGTLEVSPLRENIVHPDEARQALGVCLESLGRGNGQSSRPLDVALAVPDQAARVFFLNFDAFPSRPSQAVPLIRWKLKKSVPFDIDASTVSYLAQRRQTEWEILAVVTPDAIIRQYELLLEDAGLKPRFVTLSSLGSLGLISSSETVGPQSEPSRFLLAKYSPPWLTTSIVYDGSVRLFRTVAVGAGNANEAGNNSGKVSVAESPEALRDILEAIHPSVAYFQDNFGMPLQRAYLCGLGPYTELIASSLNDELNLPTRPLLREAMPPVAGWDAAAAERHVSAILGIARERRRA